MLGRDTVDALGDINETARKVDSLNLLTRASTPRSTLFTDSHHSATIIANQSVSPPLLISIKLN